MAARQGALEVGDGGVGVGQLPSDRQRFPESDQGVLRRDLRNRPPGRPRHRPSPWARAWPRPASSGVVDRRDRRPQDALIAFREALAIRRKLADANPTVNRLPELPGEQPLQHRPPAGRHR